MKKIFRICKERQPRFNKGFIFLAYTGCRVAEVQGIRPDDVDWDNKIVWVVGKGSKRRPLKLTGAASPAFDALKDEWMYHSKPHGFIFSQSPTWARKGMERLSRNAFNGKKHGHPHMLRHTLASMALLHFKPVWDIQFLAKWLGHEDIRTTYKIYGHWIAKEPPSGYEERLECSCPV